MHSAQVAQDRDLFGELTHAGTCGGCPWRGEQRNTWSEANADARAHVAHEIDRNETRERSAAIAQGADWARA